MIKIISSKSILALDFYFTQKLKIDYLGFVVNKKNEAPLFKTWEIANWTDLSSYISSGSNGIFDLGVDDKNDLIVVKSSGVLNIDDSTAKYLAECSKNTDKEVFIHVNSDDINASLKKSLEKQALEFIEIKELDQSQKINLIKLYIDSNYPNAKKHLTLEVLNYLSDFDWLPGLIDKIDFLELANIDSWVDFVNSTATFNPNIFKFSISKPLSPFQLKTIYTLFQSPEQNQLLITMIYSQLRSKPDLKDWLKKLIQTDYLSKTKLDSLLWAKLWMYDILN